MTNPARRRWLAWAARGVYGACAAAVAWPTARFLAAPLGAPPERPTLDRVEKLSALKPGVPKLVAVTGESVDAWTRHPARTVGRAWVVRTSPAGVAPEKAELRAFSAVCPHAGCLVSGTVDAGATSGADPSGAAGVAGGEVVPHADGLLCPCHGAVFAADDGSRLPLPDGRPNPSPRGLDPLACEAVEGEDGTWWVQLEYRRYRPGAAGRIEV